MARKTTPCEKRATPVPIPNLLSDLSGSFTIHSEDFEPGVKAETVASAGLDVSGKFELKDFRLLHIKLKRRQDRQEILSLKRTIYVMNHAGTTKIPKIPSYNLNYCTKYLQQILGAKYCLAATIPHIFDAEGQPKIPFMRSMEASVVVEKTDKNMEGYEFLLQLPEYGSRKERKYKFLLDTPNSAINRKFSVDLIAKRPNAESTEIALNAVNPFYSLDINGSITRIATFMDNVSEHVDITELEVKLKKIDQLQRKIEELKELLFGLETAKPTEEAEFEDLYKCETRLDDLEVRVKELINSINVSLCVTAVEKNKYENGTFAQTKIPPIILPTFSGKYEQFSNFKSQFDDLIATSEQLTQSQKLYLNSCLSNEVKEFASTFDTFSSLYEALESRYDNKRLIVDINVQQILNFKKIERENPKEIREMIDCIKKNLRALKLLNYEQNNLFNVFLLNIMLKKLDNESRKNFELSLKAKDVPTFDEFIAFLEQRETILLSVDKNCIVETKTILRKPNLSFKTKTNLLINQSVENKSCIVCKDKTLHPIFRCKKFLELNPEKRLDLVRLHKLCELCLRKNHKRMQCTSTYVCPCGKKHSRSLCTAAKDDRKKWVIPSAELPVLTNPEDRESNVVDSSTQNTVLSSTASQHRKNVLISTGSVFLRNNEGRELKCPVIFDSASNINIISRKMCDFLGIAIEKINSSVSGLNSLKQNLKGKTLIL
ncbi:uncharacterized protein TNCV_1273091 [Trichonephila clavipes]|nr:uncharacterized protein TNCV_1273091 [Trichonephila clavipes]